MRNDLVEMSRTITTTHAVYSIEVVTSAGGVFTGLYASGYSCGPPPRKEVEESLQLDVSKALFSSYIVFFLFLA